MTKLRPPFQELQEKLSEIENVSNNEETNEQQCYMVRDKKIYLIPGLNESVPTHRPPPNKIDQSTIISQKNKKVKWVKHEELEKLDCVISLCVFLKGTS